MSRFESFVTEDGRSRKTRSAKISIEGQLLDLLEGNSILCDMFITGFPNEGHIAGVRGL